jgi:hypothetical protein
MFPFLLSFTLLFAGSQQVKVFEADVSNLKLSHELIYGHPGMIAGDYDSYATDLLTAIEIDYRSSLLNEACLMLRSANARSNKPLSSARLARLIELLDGGIASDFIIDAFARNLNSSRFRIPERMPFREDLYSSWIDHWYVANNLGNLEHRNPLDQQIELPLRTDLSDWQRIVRRPHLKVCNAAANVTIDAGYGVAVSYFKSKVGPALLDLVCDEPVQLWLNGVQIFDHTSFSVYSSPIETLHQVPVVDGWNEIMLCYAVESNPQIGARILDYDGGLRAVDEWKSDSEFPRLPHRANFSAPRVELFAVSDSDDAFSRVREVVLNTYMPFMPQALDVETPQQMNTHEQLAWLCARFAAANSAKHYDASILRQMIDGIYSQIEESEYYISNAYDAEIRRLLSEDRKDSALELSESLLSDMPNNSELQILRTLCRSYFDYSFAMTRSELEALIIKYPHEVTAWNILIQQAERTGNLQRHLNLLEQRLQFTGIGASILIKQLLSGGQQQQQRGFAMIQRLLDERPQSSTALDLLDQWHLVNNDRQTVAERYESDSDRFPLVAERSLLALSKLYGAGQTSEALAILDRFATLAPSAAGVTNWQRELNLNPRCDAFFTEYAPDIATALDGRSVDKANAQFSTTLLMDSTLYYVFADNGFLSQSHILTQINNKQGALDSGTQAVSGTPIHMRVIKTDGSVFEAHQVDDSWVLPTLEPGDVIDSKFEYSGQGSVATPPRLGMFSLQAFNQPYDVSRVVYYIDDTALGEFRVANFDDEQIIEGYDKGSVHIFENLNAPALTPEGFMPATETLLPNVNYGTDFDLAISANQLYHQMLDLSQCPVDVESQLKSWLADLNPEGNDQQRAAVIYWAVQDLISEYDGFNDIIDTFTLGQGRPIGLLSKLYELNEIRHEWAFIKQQAPHLIKGRPAFENANAYQIPALRLAPTVAGEQPLWVLTIEHYAPLGLAPTDMYGAEAVIVTRDSYRSEVFNPQIPDDLLNIDANVHYFIRDDGSADVTGDIHILTMLGAQIRKQLKQISPDQLQQAQLSFAGQFITGLDVSNGNFYQPDVDNDDHLFHYSFNGNIPNFVQGRGERLGGRLRFPLSTAIHAQLGKAEREYDFELDLREFNRVKVRVTTEGAYTMDYGPVSRHETAPGFDYDIVIAKSANEINLSIATGFDGLKTSKEEFPEFLALLQDIEKQEKRMIEFMPRLVEVEVVEEAPTEAVEETVTDPQ